MSKCAYLFDVYNLTQKQPELKNFIRGISYVTGFTIRPSGEGCELTYITQSDPKGGYVHMCLDAWFG